MNGLKLLTEFEGFRPSPYLDSSNVWTIGFGHTFFYNGKQLKGNVSKSYLLSLFPDYSFITRNQGLKLLQKDLQTYENIVSDNISVPLNQNQIDALISHTYNTGGSETLFRLINRKAPYIEIYKWFTEHYITSGGRTLKGLIIRRKKEADLFFS